MYFWVWRTYLIWYFLERYVAVFIEVISKSVTFDSYTFQNSENWSDTLWILFAEALLTDCLLLSKSYRGPFPPGHGTGCWEYSVDDNGKTSVTKTVEKRTAAPGAQRGRTGYEGLSLGFHLAWGGRSGDTGDACVWWDGREVPLGTG